MSNTLIDNSENLKLVDNIKSLLSDSRCNHLKIATGYWDLPGTALIQDELRGFFERGGRLDLLIGKEPQLRGYQQRQDLPEEELFPDFYIARDVDTLTEEFKPVAKLILDNTNPDDEDNSPIRIHVYGQGQNEQFLHAKCYIFLGPGYGRGIIGSSNFTEKGFHDNAELNYLETESAVVTAGLTEYVHTKSHNVWFDQMWEQSHPWTGKFIKEILTKSPLGKEITKEQAESAAPAPVTPYELYIKLLQLRFGDLVDKDTSAALESYLPTHFHKLDYQMTAVKQCYSIMKVHGGFMLGDVVGLGKTIVGVLLIKFFLDFPEADRERKVLIVTPPAIKSAWLDTIDEFDKGVADKIKDKVDFVTTGSLGHLVDDVDDEDDEGDGEFEDELRHDNYGLIIIDESHKFRNSNTQMYRKLDQIIGEIGAATGLYPYIGLLSATPQNNTPEDLRNQIYLFERNHKYCTLEKVPGYNLESYFAQVDHKYEELRKHAGALRAQIEDGPSVKEELGRVNQKLIELSQDIRDKVLCDILVRRTRTDILKYYEADIKAENIVFPTIKGPCELKYRMDDELADLFADTMKLICTPYDFRFDNSDYLCYYRYQAIKFFSNPAVANSYKVNNLTPERSSEQLARIMQINLVKRLESSFAAFRASLHNLRTYTQNMIDMWHHDTIFICPDINVNAELDVLKHRKKNKSKPVLTFAQCAQDIRKKIQKLNAEGRNIRGRNTEFRRYDFKEEYIDKLQKDYALIDELCKRWDANYADPKFDIFKESLVPVLLDPRRNPAKKLVIFTEAKDTLKSLKAAVKSKGLRVLCISADNRSEMEPIIRANFDANFKGEQRNDYDVIITTEVLAEGINLHRANSILNYDTPWNSTRLMQRIGRVNRIGSKAPYIYVYNFMPSAQGDSKINLVQRAYTKLQSFHSLFGEDSKIFTEEETLVPHDLNTEVNGEESPFEKYLHQLRLYKAACPERYQWLLVLTKPQNLAVAADGNSYLVVKSPKTNGLFVKVTPDYKASVIPAIEMFRDFFSEPSAVSVPLPPDWPKIEKTARDKMIQHLNSISKTDTNREKRVTLAKGVIQNIIRKENLSQESLALLDSAYGYVRSGNNDIINRVLRIGQEIENSGTSLFDITPDEIAGIINDGIGFIEARQIQQDGKPEVILGVHK